MSNNNWIQAALANSEFQEVFNYFKTAKKHGIGRIILMRRFTRKIVLHSEANTEYWQALNIAQKKVLLGHIQRLVTGDTLPTPTLVRNFAEEIYGSCLRKNWTTQFIQRYSVYLRTLYLCNSDNLEKKAEYAPYFQLFYKLVCIWLSDSFEIDVNLIQFASAVEKYWITKENM